jgi:aerobic carbon-monoxide dehydrogenase medium subunit
MPTVRYEAPRSVSDAVRLMQSDPDARVLAGGTDLLIQFRAGLRQPSAFVDVKRIPELVEIAGREDGVRIGASAPAAAICEHATLQQWWPGLVEAVHLIGSTQIQGRASIGGNLCNASPAADSVCALIVDRAVCIIAGSGGERRVPVEQFCSSPGRTVLQPGELLIGVDLPRPQPGTSDAYLRLIPRSEMDIAVVGAGVSVTLDPSGRCTAARVAIGAVAPTALLVPAAGEALVDSMLDDDALSRAADLARAAARPIDDKRGTTAYRRHVVGVLVKRAAAVAAARAKGRRA